MSDPKVLSDMAVLSLLPKIVTPDPLSIEITLKTRGIVHAENQTEESAKVISELLNENHEKHHIYTTSEEMRGVYLHNHIAHHDLTLWAIGATPAQMRSHHARNSQYQQGAITMQDIIVKDLHDPRMWERCIGKEAHFRNFLRFFEGEIGELGVEKVLQKYLVGKTPFATDILGRCYMGLTHGIIHIGLGLEFQQPAILAEGLAQACVHHEQFVTDFLVSCENEAAKTSQPALPLAACIDACRADPVISTCSSHYYHEQLRPVSGQPCMDDEPIRDAVLGKAINEMRGVAIQYRVDPNDLERATAELINTAVYFAAGAQRPPHACRYDFFLLHCVTSSIMHSTLLTEPSISNYQKARLLEYTGRAMLITYASMGSPEPRLEWVIAQPSKLPNQNWNTLFARAAAHADDGHMSKLIRCIRNAQRVSEKFDAEEAFRCKQDVLFKAAEVAIDGGSEVPMYSTFHFDFVRGAGFKEAFDNVPVVSSIEVKN